MTTYYVLSTVNIILHLLIYLATSDAFSFTAEGKWGNASYLDCERFMCSPKKLTWNPSYSSKFYDSVSGCEALEKKGITTIFFHGDSYMRQIYAGMFITLNGDYKYGSIANPTSTPQCSYQKQFNEKFCGFYQLNHVGRICNGKILLDPLLTGVDKLDHCSSKNGTILLWSFGNHRLTRIQRQGINDPIMYQDFFRRTACDNLNKHLPITNTASYHDQSCTTIWIPTHYRYRTIFGDETPEMVEHYNLEMRKFFDSGECGHVNYVDVFNMTKDLAVNHPTEAQQMTYDGVHWGMEVNLVKAQIILNAILN